MITSLSHTTIWVLDQDEALEFYTRKLGFEVNTDATMDDFRWLTVNPPERPDHELILLVPGPPMMDEESAAQVKALVAKGALGAGAFETDDCRATYAELHGRGVTFLTEPTERFYGIEATFRDNSGNWFSNDPAHRGAGGDVTMFSRRHGSRLNGTTSAASSARSKATNALGM